MWFDAVSLTSIQTLDLCDYTTAGRPIKTTSLIILKHLDSVNFAEAKNCVMMNGLGKRIKSTLAINLRTTFANYAKSDIIAVRLHVKNNCFYVIRVKCSVYASILMIPRGLITCNYTFLLQSVNIPWRFLRTDSALN